MHKCGMSVALSQIVEEHDEHNGTDVVIGYCSGWRVEGCGKHDGECSSYRVSVEVGGNGFLQVDGEKNGDKFVVGFDSGYFGLIKQQKCQRYSNALKAIELKLVTLLNYAPIDAPLLTVAELKSEVETEL